MKLTKTVVARLRAPDPSGKDKLIWDTELKGFGVRVSGTTTVRSYIAQRTLPNGLTRRVTIGSVAEIDVDTARAKAAESIHQMRGGIDPKVVQRSAAQWALWRVLDEYLAARKALRPNTRRLYRHWTEQHLAAWLDRPLRTITPDEVEQRHRAICREVAKRHRQPEHFKSENGSRTANDTMRILAVLWNFLAERDETLPRNPVRRLRRQWYAEPRRTRSVRPDQLPAFYAAVNALPHAVFRDYIKLLLFTGLRREEAASLTWEMIDFTNRVIRVPGSQTKTQQPLDLPMSSFVRDLLVARRSLGDSHWVFPASRRGYIGTPTSHFEAIAAACGVRVSAHDLRRTYLTVAEAADISPLALKALVNHTLGGDVTSGYLQMSVERLREPAQHVCDRLLELIGLTQPEAAADNVTRIA